MLVLANRMYTFNVQFKVPINLVSLFYLNYFYSRFFIEQQTKPPLPEGTLLDKPEFTTEHIANNNVFDTVRIVWKPKLDSNPGSHFFVKYR